MTVKRMDNGGIVVDADVPSGPYETGWVIRLCVHESSPLPARGG